MQVFNSIAPIFVMVALGWYLTRIQFLPTSTIPVISKLVFWVAVPSLLVQKIASVEIESGPAGRIFLVMLLSMLGMIAFSFILCRLFSVASQNTGPIVQGAFRSNAIFVGLPVIFYSFSGEQAENVTNLATVAVAPIIPFLNIASIFVLAGMHKEKPAISLWKLTLDTFKNPLVVSCSLGIVLSLLEFPLPLVLDRSLKALGQIALPLALLLVGSSISFSELRNGFKAALVPSLLKVALLPAMGYWVAQWLGLNDLETYIALVFLACPTAVISFVMVQQMGGNHRLGANIVVLSTLLSGITLSVVLAMYI